MGRLKVPGIDVKIPLGSGYLLYSAPGYFAFGGGMDYSFFGVVSVSGRLDGEMNFANGRFNLGGRVSGCVADIICRTLTGVVSSRGVGGCAGLGPLDIGGGVIYSPFKVILNPWGCRWSRFKEPNVFVARAAQAGGPIKFRMKAGDPGRALDLVGEGGAPRVRVTAPGGAVLDDARRGGRRDG